MARYFARSCPLCNGYVDVVIREQEHETLQTVNGQCVRCCYRFAWIVVRGGGARSRRPFRRHVKKNA
jgi:hypothetical protein